MAAVIIPKRLPISGSKGAERLLRLEDRASYLANQIVQFPNNHRYRAELAALVWVIKNIILYEELLKKGPEDPDPKVEP